MRQCRVVTQRTHHPAGRSGGTPHHSELQSGLGNQRRYDESEKIREVGQSGDPKVRWTHRVLATGRTPSLDQLGLVLSHARPEYQGLLAQPQLLTETAKRRTKFLRRLPVPSHRLLPESAPARPSHIYADCYSSPCTYCQKLKQGSLRPLALRGTGGVKGRDEPCHQLNNGEGPGST